MCVCVCVCVWVVCVCVHPSRFGRHRAVGSARQEYYYRRWRFIGAGADAPPRHSMVRDMHCESASGDCNAR